MNTPFTRPLATLSPELIARFAAIVGEKYAITDPADQEPYLIEGRGLYRGSTPLVLRPGSVAEVAAIVKLADETVTPIVPQGGNTGLVGGQIPHHAEADRLFPLSVGAEGSCTIGGNLSTNAGGTSAFAYGVARDLVVGLEVVLADGRILNALNKLKKDNTGYDLKNLFVGAEGTLGVITAAVLKLFPAPKTVETAFIGVPSPQAAIKLIGLIQERTNRAATGFELICRRAVDFALRHGHGVRDPLDHAHPWYALLQVASATRQDLRTTLEEALETAMERGLVNDAAVADSVEH